LNGLRFAEILEIRIGDESEGLPFGCREYTRNFPWTRDGQRAQQDGIDDARERGRQSDSSG
jgi:hypothetical protein